LRRLARSARPSIFRRASTGHTFAELGPSAVNRNPVLERRMTSISALWLPILLSSVIVFFASSLIHMVLPWHKSDFPKLANEEQVMDALRPLGLAPGDYMMPRPADMAEMKTDAFKAKAERGPRVLMTVMPLGTVSMTRELGLWFVYLIVVNILTAYVAAHALLPGAPFRAVVRYAGLVSFIAYSSALWQLWIWYRRDLGITIKSTVDSLIYGVLTALTFAYLWPRG
jgi:hypothetical protein